MPIVCFLDTKLQPLRVSRMFSIFVLAGEIRRPMLEGGQNVHRTHTEQSGLTNW